MGAICTGIQVVTGLTGAIKQKNASIISCYLVGCVIFSK